MKIGITGPNPGNEAYTWAKLLNKKGFEVIQFTDSYYISDNPIWIERKIEIPIDHEFNSGFWDKSRLRKFHDFEEQYEWKNPEWFNHFQEMKVSYRNLNYTLVSLMIGKYRNEIRRYLRTNYGTKYLLSSYLKITKILQQLKECDVVISQGWGMMLPYLAKIPYIVIPYGTEIMPENKNRRDFIDPLKSAYQVGSYFGYYEEWLEMLGIKNRFPFHTPMDTSVYRPLRVGKNEFVFQEKLKDKYVFFMPSRIHFEYKGTDKVLMAFKKIANKFNESLLVLINWGSDRKRIADLRKKFGISENVLVIDQYLSNKSQNVLFNLSDVIMDQFPRYWNSGNIGGLGRSASLTGKPLITTYSHEHNKFLNPEKPPFIAAFTEYEIFEAMKFCLENKEEAKEIGEKTRKWALKYYGDNAVIKLIELLKKTRENAPKLGEKN